MTSSLHHRFPRSEQPRSPADRTRRTLVYWDVLHHGGRGGLRVQQERPGRTWRIRSRFQRETQKGKCRTICTIIPYTPKPHPHPPAPSFMCVCVCVCVCGRMGQDDACLGNLGQCIMQCATTLQHHNTNRQISFAYICYRSKSSRQCDFVLIYSILMLPTSLNLSRVCGQCEVATDVHS